MLHITAVGRNGLPAKVVDMNARAREPDQGRPADHPPDREVPRPTGHYIAEGIRVPAGRWVLTINAYPTDVDVVTATTDITVG